MLRWVALGLALALTTQAHAQRRPRPTVAAVAPGRLAVGQATLPFYASQDLSKPQPGITRAVLVLHGVLRNADTYFRSAQAAQAAAGAAGRTSLMIAPQFLDTADAVARDLSPDVLRWERNAWEGGEPAAGPAPTSSYAALDAVLALLADRTRFPNLKTVVVAGHSGGAQVVQRYAVANTEEPALRAAGIAVRYVVANPSSYVYFDARRPVPPVGGSCPGFDDWKYGMNGRPPYLAAPTPSALLNQYAGRDVVYLLGGLDRNPNHPALDRSCMAETQGVNRFERGESYFAALTSLRPGALRHRLVEVPGVGHDGDAMFTSPCGVAALFGDATCNTH